MILSMCFLIFAQMLQVSKRLEKLLSFVIKFYYYYLTFIYIIMLVYNMFYDIS